MIDLRVARIDAGCRDDFFRLHCSKNEAGRCCCVAWWVPTWEGWGDRTVEQNRRLRELLFERGEYDGYLLYVDGEPVGWCQAGPRDKLAKLARQFALRPDPHTWAISCFFIVPILRRHGFATYLLEKAVQDMRERGARRIEAYPKRGDDLTPDDLWRGPESIFRSAGFHVVRDDLRDPVLAIEW